MMDRQNVIDGLKEAQQLLSDHVPVILAWEAIKAIKAVVELLTEGVGG